MELKYNPSEKSNLKPFLVEGKPVLSLLVLLFLMGCGTNKKSEKEATEDKPKPNILFLLAEDISTEINL